MNYCFFKLKVLQRYNYFSEPDELFLKNFRQLSSFHFAGVFRGSERAQELLGPMQVFGGVDAHRFHVGQSHSDAVAVL